MYLFNLLCHLAVSKKTISSRSMKDVHQEQLYKMGMLDVGMKGPSSPEGELLGGGSAGAVAGNVPVLATSVACLCLGLRAVLSHMALKIRTFNECQTAVDVVTHSLAAVVALGSLVAIPAHVASTTAGVA